MKKRDLIAALQPLDDDTEILIVNGVPCEQIEYIDDRFRDQLIRKDQVRLQGYREINPGAFNPRLFPPQILGIDPLRAS
ncbi:MAG: hypothetical protein IJI36_02710 [Kiritimatiellae bacterium]|nr:hypothetical protein [Kiritimatiellia bacterium]